MRLVAVILGILLVASVALGRPPPGSDPSGPTAQWYRGLTQNGSGASCCGDADCRAVEARVVDGHWQARVDRATFGDSAPDGWVDIPDAAILKDKVSIEDRPVLCWRWAYVTVPPMLSNGVMCFIRSEQI